MKFELNNGANVFRKYWSEKRPCWSDLFPYYKLRRIIKDSFLSSKTFESLLDKLRDLHVASAAFYKSSRVSFDSEKALDILDCYYDLLRFILRNTNELRNALSDYSMFLKIFLNIGLDFSENAVTPFAPRYLLAILEMDRQWDVMRKSEYRRTVFMIYLKRYMQWFAILPDGTLGYIDGLRIRAHDRYERINVLSLYDKIVYERPSRVLIAGNVDFDSMFKLSHLFENVQFVVFSNENVDYKDSGLAFYNYKKLFRSSASLTKWIQSCDLLFFLDCYDLYEKIYVEPYEYLDSLCQQIAYHGFRRKYKAMQDAEKVLSVNLDSKDQNTFCLLHNCLIGAFYANDIPAVLKKKINETMFCFIEKQLHGKTAYFYYSDLNATDKLPYRYEHYGRRELHEGKSIYIFRCGKECDTALELSNDNVIVFDLWQFASYIGLPEPSFHSLAAVEYSKDLQLLRILCEPDSKSYVRQFIYQCFLSKNDDIYHRYFLVGFYSFLEDFANSIDDLLFLHKMHYTTCYNVELSICDLALQDEVKYSTKRFYKRLIANYDTPAEYFPDQYKIVDDMEKFGGISASEAFLKIKEACEQHKYTDSYLYMNCKDIVETGSLTGTWRSNW